MNVENMKFWFSIHGLMVGFLFKGISDKSIQDA